MRNFLTDAVYKRWDSHDPKLRHDLPIAADLNNPERSFFVDLSATPESTPSEAGITFGNAFGGPVPESVIVNEYQNTTLCPALIKPLTRERYYLQQCLLSATKCDYGLTLALWARFHTSEYVGTEVLLATSPETAQGFQLYLKAGELLFELRSSERRWFISSPFVKPMNKWTNIAVAWGKSTETLRLLVDKQPVAEKTRYTGVEYYGSSAQPTALHLGCVQDANGVVVKTSIAQNLEVAAVSMWYWPIQMDALLTGGLELYLIEHEVQTTTTAVPMIDRSTYRDYSAEVEEYSPPDSEVAQPNPMYTSADLYVSMQSEPVQSVTTDIELVNASARRRKAYKMVSESSYTELHAFSETGCPTKMSACLDGLSVGFWLQINSTTDSSSYPIDLVELVGVFRISLYKGTINVFVNLDGTLSAFRVITPAPKDIWFNLGLAIQRIPTLSVHAYFNAVPMQVSQVVPLVDRGQERSNVREKSLLLGGLSQSRSAVGTSVNDLIMWYRGLKPFERHRFVGYTRTQLTSLLRSANYWTPDTYILQDAETQIQARKKYDYMNQGINDCETGTNGFCLASIYKPKKSTYRCHSRDPWDKSCAPIFDMTSKHYMLLGRNKSAEVTLDKLTWTGHCLHDPSESLCGLRGFTLSMWLKLITVSNTRLRFYLTSGDSGTSSLYIKDYRGVTIFSDASLIGVSVSQRYKDWKLILDSESYQLNHWINVGILWREDVGLTMLIDGVSYGSSDVQGYKVFKVRLASPYVVLGRFNTDEESTWLSPIKANQELTQNGNENGWEMANFALGEVTYFSRLLTEAEYRSHFGLLGISRLRKVDGYLWHGADLVDAQIRQLIQAASENLPRPGPILSNATTSMVKLLTNPAAVELSGKTSLRLGPISPRQCPADLSKCTEGLSVGAWIRLGGPKFSPTDADTTPVILFTGAGGSFGLSMQQNGNYLGAWIIKKSEKFYCATNNAKLAVETMNMQWIHVAIVYGAEEGQLDFALRILINGRVTVTCQTITGNTPSNLAWVENAAILAKQLYSETATPEAYYLLMSSEGLHEVGSNLSVALLTIQPATLIGANAMKLLGVEYSHLFTLQRSTFFWTFTGIVRFLAPDRAMPYGVRYDLDKDDTPLGAWCTDSSRSTYITLTGDKLSDESRVNLAAVCMMNPKKCNEYVLTIQFKLLQTVGQGNMLELFRSTPLNSAAETIGLQILVSPANESLTVIVRNEIQVFNQSVLFKDLGRVDSWITLEVFYSEKGIKLRKRGIVLPTFGPTSSNLVSNYPLPSTQAASMRLIIGREIPVCVASVSILDVSGTDNAENLMDGFSSSSCYPEVDYINQLKGAYTDHKGQADVATRLGLLTQPIDVGRHPCLHDPTACKSGELITSIWMKIVGFDDPQGNNIELDSISNLSAVIYTTGPPKKRGVLMELLAVRESEQLTLNLRSTLQTDTELWQVYSYKALELNTWTNVGLYWYAPKGGKSGAMEVYINGERRQSSTLPRTKINLNSKHDTESYLKFARAYMTSSDVDSELIKAVPNGLVSNFAFWNSTGLSCSRPRKTKQRLQGDCEVDTTVPEVAQCTVLRDCYQAEGAVCLDETVENLNRMALQSGRLSDPMDFQRILGVADRLITSTLTEGESVDDSNKLSDVLKSTVILLQAWASALENTCEVLRSSFCTTLHNIRPEVLNLLSQLGAQLSTNALSDAWSKLLQDGSLTQNDVVNAMSSIMKTLATTLNSNASCSQEVQTGLLSGNVIATIRHANLTDTCIDQTDVLISAKSFHNQSSKSYGVWFKLNQSAIDTDLNADGYLTLINIPGPESEASLIAGGLSVTAFTSHALVGAFHDNDSWTKVSDPVQQAFQRPASELRISSPVFLVDTNFQLASMDQLQQSPLNPVIMFAIELSTFNTFQDVQFYETTGRSLWRALEAEQMHKLGESGHLPLAFPVRCVFWNATATSGKTSEGAWDDTGCWVVGANLTHVTCACSHLSVFAIAKEPRGAPGTRQPYWIVWGIGDREKNTMVVRILLVAINGISLMSTIIFLSTLIAFLFRTPFKDIYLIHCLLCVAFALLHAGLIAQPLTEHSKVGCQAVGLLIHASSMLSASWLLCEAIALFRCFVLGDFQVRRAWTWILGFGIPALVLILSAILSKLNQHGCDLLCLPAHESYVFWTMFGTLFGYLITALIICMVINCNIETPAFIQPEMIERLINRVGQLNFLIIYTTAAWSAIVLVIMFPIPYLPYISFAAISLQGTLLFFTLALDDVDIRNFYRGKQAYIMEKKDKRAKAALLPPKVVPDVRAEENEKQTTAFRDLNYDPKPSFGRINEQSIEADEEPQSNTHVHKRGKKKKKKDNNQQSH